MKKLLLIILLAVSFNFKAGVVIDSLSLDTVCIGSFLRVYMHTTGTVTPSNPLSLHFNSLTVVSGTYQTLADSNFVWGFIIPASTYPGYPIWATISIAGSQILPGTLWYDACYADVGINESQYSGKIISVRYLSLMGEYLETAPYNQVIIKETRYTIGVRREKILIEN